LQLLQGIRCLKAVWHDAKFCRKFVRKWERTHERSGCDKDRLWSWSFIGPDRGSLSFSNKFSTKFSIVSNKLYIFDMVTISFVCHQKPHSLQPNQIYGNLVTNIPKCMVLPIFEKLCWHRCHYNFQFLSFELSSFVFSWFFCEFISSFSFYLSKNCSFQNSGQL
jgi:hypothetical protein